MQKLPQLLVMMFLQFFVQGAWSMLIGTILSAYGMENIVGQTYAMLGLATVLSPLFIGMVADRFIASQRMMALLQILIALVLCLVPTFIVNQNEYGFLIVIFVVGLLFYPTSALANSISFRHIDGVKWFPIVRVFGTFGFMVVGFTLSYTGFSKSINAFYLAAAAALVYALYALTLPDTPPLAKGRKFSMRDVLCLDALSLFKDKYFSIFMLATFVLMISKTAYVSQVPVFLPKLGLEPGQMMQIGTAVEIIFMVLLGLMLRRFGFKKIILFGAVSWIIRSLMLSQAAVSEGDWMFTWVVGALLMQGFCWDLFFTAGDIYVDKKADPTIKAQAQSLRVIICNGFGVFMAGQVLGKIHNTVITADSMPEAATQWQTFWLYPAAVAAVVSIAFFLFFNDKDVIVEAKEPAETATQTA